MKRYILTVLVVLVLGLVAASGLYAHGTHALTADLTVAPTNAAPGATVTLTGVAGNVGARKENVHVEMHRVVNGAMVDIFKDFNVTLKPGETHSFPVPYTVPANEPNGTITFHMQCWFSRGGLVVATDTATLTVP